MLSCRLVVFSSLIITISVLVLTIISSVPQCINASAAAPTIMQSWNATLNNDPAQTAILPSSVGFIAQYNMLNNDNDNSNNYQLLIATDYRTGKITAIRSDTAVAVYTRTYTGIGRSVASSTGAASQIDLAVFTTHSGTVLQAIRASTGSELWMINLTQMGIQTVTCAPTISGDILAIRANNNILAGRIVSSASTFSFNLVNYTMVNDGVSTSELAPFIFNDNRYIFTIDSGNIMYAIDISTNTQYWNHSHAATIASPNIVYFREIDRLIFLGGDSRLHAHNGMTGMTAWKIATGSSSTCTSSVFHDSTRNAVFFLCEDSRVVAINNITADGLGGDILINQIIPSSVVGAGAVVVRSGVVFNNAEGMLYFGDSMGRFIVMDTQVHSNQAFPTIASGNQNFTFWTWDASMSDSNFPFTFVPVLTTLTDLFTTTPIVVLGNQRTLYAYKISTSNGASSSGMIPSIPIQFDINIGLPSSQFLVLTFISNLFLTLGIDALNTPYKVNREEPLGGSLFRTRISFASQETVNQILGMSMSQMQSLKIVGMRRYAAPTSAAPVTPKDEGGPLGAAIGATCGIVTVFLILLGVGIWKSTQELPKNLADLNKEGTQHASFHFSGVDPNAIQATREEDDYNMATNAQQQQNYNNNNQNHYNQRGRGDTFGELMQNANINSNNNDDYQQYHSPAQQGGGSHQQGAGNFDPVDL